jgi:hypothetical protein
MIHPKTEEAFQEIDAAVFTGDGIYRKDDQFRKRLAYFLRRWELTLISQVHLSEPRGGWFCGAKDQIIFGTENADINLVTCEKCIAEHEKTVSLANARVKLETAPFEYNVCKTCGACDGRCGNTVDGECLCCRDTRESQSIVAHVGLPRTQEEIARMEKLIII